MKNKRLKETKNENEGNTNEKEVKYNDYSFSDESQKSQIGQKTTSKKSEPFLLIGSIISSTKKIVKVKMILITLIIKDFLICF